MALTTKTITKVTNGNEYRYYEFRLNLDSIAGQNFVKLAKKMKVTKATDLLEWLINERTARERIAEEGKQ